MQKLSSSWKTLKESYKLTDILGEGTGGQVVKATHRLTK